jgi:hypothetical protein
MWENFKLGDPYRQASFYDSYTTSEVAWTQAEKLAELQRQHRGPRSRCVELTLQILPQQMCKHSLKKSSRGCT